MLFRPSIRVRERLYGFEADAYDGENWFLSHLDGDIARLIRLKEDLNHTSSIVNVFCYPEQEEMLKRFLGDRIKIHLVELETIERRLGLVTEEADD
jgi:hypothetical protein